MWHIQQIVSEHSCHRSCVVARPAKFSGSSEEQYWAKIFTGSKLQPDFDRFSRQIEFSSSVDSPGLIPVVDANLTSTSPIVVYPFVEAQTLDSWLNSRSQFLSNLRLIKLVRQLLEALNAIHIAGMAHCQINLDHILVTDFDESLRLIGLGGVEPISKYVQLSRPVSPFDAPEVRNGFFEVSSAIDVFAVGRLIIQLFGNNAASWPIVQAMTSTKAVHRPTSSELLLLLEDLENRQRKENNRVVRAA
ncbi:MAG: hypothetical protein U0930_02520 [Pirellulales bacterium]